MTREEAINIMNVIVHMLEEKYDTDRVEEAVDMAIKALSAETCDDCIRRAKAIESIKHAQINFSVESDIDFTKHKREVQEIADGILNAQIKVLSELPSIQPKPKTEWIPVSERLPESCGMYIVTRKIYDCPDTAPIIMSDESWFDGQNTWHNDNRINHNRGYLSDVIAWMPLPEPYKEESEDKE